MPSVARQTRLGSGQRSLGCRAEYLDFEALDFAKDRAPVIQGQRTITVTSDDLTFAQSADVIVPVPAIPEDQMNYLGTKLP